MSTRYSSAGTSVGRSPKTSVAAPWVRRAQLTFVAGANALVPYSTTAHTKGAWTQIHASTPSSASLLYLSPVSNTSSAALFDVGVGAAGSEVAVIENISYGGRVDTNMFPIAVPAGSRVAVRVQGVLTNPTTSNVGVTLVYSESDYRLLPTALGTIGVSTATSQGTAMSGASGSWVEITSSTAKDYQCAFLMVACSASTATITPTFTLGVGAAGAEIALGAKRERWAAGLLASNSATPPMQFYWAAGPIPAGSRLSVRHDLASTPGSFNVAIYGVPYV